MASYFDDHSLEDPLKARGSSRNQGRSLNPDLSHFMPREDDDDDYRSDLRSTSTASGPGAGDFRRLAEMLGGFRAREEPLGDEAHQEFLDNLITQLMDEAGASGKHGPPSASKSFIRDLPFVPHGDHNNCPACRAEVPSDDPDWIKKKRDAELAKYAAEAEIDEDWMYS
ncbi:hypothetical protein BG011_006965 [Mortierella polycephala]|uniref:Uncharacterized protein n=1 Tax=Mortierella polycephala TaxID=41804 RepID=A0A9P6QCP4_9FUNG|nr:hypothetical protein BG011_006965 [Mortierella polycephala]